MAEAVHIGTVAKLAGVSVDTIRFYQKLGLIKSASRSSSGYRLFDGEQIRELKFVRHAQELGFSLTEVKELLALRQKHHACAIHAQAQSWRMCTRKSSVLSGWKRSLQGHSAIAIASCA